jgi:hypothetical protein
MGCGILCRSPFPDRRSRTCHIPVPHARCADSRALARRSFQRERGKARRTQADYGTVMDLSGVTCFPHPHFEYESQSVERSDAALETSWTAWPGACWRCPTAACWHPAGPPSASCHARAPRPLRAATGGAVLDDGDRIPRRPKLDLAHRRFVRVLGTLYCLGVDAARLVIREVRRLDVVGLGVAHHLGGEVVAVAERLLVLAHQHVG